MTSDTTSHLDLTLMVAFHDAFRRDLGHLARAASRRPAELDEPARRTAVQAGWERLAPPRSEVQVVRSHPRRTRTGDP